MGRGGVIDLERLGATQQRRESSVWTRVHPIFAIGQLGVFLVSVVLLVLYLLHVISFTYVFDSVLIKVGFMIGAIITGSLWEHDVYGAWWFAHEFFVEDVMTANVFFLHVIVLVIALGWPANMRAILGILLFGYVIYALNVAQYIVAHLRSRTSVDEDVEITAVAA